MLPISLTSTAGKIWNLLTPIEKRRAIVLLGLMFMGMLLETLGVGLVIPALALLTQGDVTYKYPVFQRVMQALGYPSQQHLVIGGMLMLVGVYFIKTLFLALLAWKQTQFAFGMQAQLSQRLFAIYLQQPYTFHLQRNSSQLIRNVTGEVTQLIDNAILPGMLLITESFVLSGLCVLLFIVEPIGALIVVNILGVATWGFYRIARSRIVAWGTARQYHDGLRLLHLQQGLGGAKDVKIFGCEQVFLDTYLEHNIKSARSARLQATLQQLPRLWLELLAVSGLAILVISMIEQGHMLNTIIPTLGLFAAAAFRIMPSTNRILGAAQSLRYGLPVINTLYTELNLVVPDVKHKSGPDMLFRNELVLNHITYAYPDTTEPALKDLSLTIRAGESVGLIGASGSGKSTLIDILLGLLPVHAGNVLLDGNDVQENLRSWQDQIGYVSQSIYLTDDSLRRNVAFGLPDAQIDNAAVQRAIHAAQLDEFVSSLPDGLETFVGERGIRLSGGQRQRIGIARALYRDPSVLVLDEATSALDTVTEQEVMQAIQALHGSKTIIIVAHRLSTIEHCDRLYRLEQGRIVEDGTPGSVLRLTQ
ncbi:ATPase [Sulfuriferula sp. AH1]|uniref:ABC transporter ATP-binding protein n=1 Tax=Sulfuriferula sp. AH1 TaxID=1985873 RepID=UPI000B57C3A1|nr:ABC transporter ATP-binding protein [Sulfuriferula sp. AH1]ARU32300.1 ATPase [Sulfuriferula sp. AH1]